MFADEFKVKLGDTVVKGRRLSIREIKANWSKMMEGSLDVATSVALIRSHVTLDDGSPFDPEDLTQGQLQTLVAELALPKEGRGISDFIGLLC